MARRKSTNKDSAKKSIRQKFVQMARNVRRQAERRINVAMSVITSNKSTEEQKKYAAQNMRRLSDLAEQTKTQSATGQRYKGRTEASMSKALKELQKAVKETSGYTKKFRDTMDVTRQQLNLASRKETEAASMYTYEERQLFYRATQFIWEGQDPRIRNELIAQYYGTRDLNKIVKMIIDKNKELQSQVTSIPTEESISEEEWMDNPLAQADNGDSEFGSPPGVGNMIISQIRDALDELIQRP